MNAAGSVLGSLNQIRFDTPYRLLASALVILASVPDDERPSGTFERFLTWLGVRGGNAYVHAVSEWLNERQQVFAGIGWILALLGCAAAVAWALRPVPPTRARSASTSLLGVALIAELSAWPSISTVVLYGLLFLIVLVLAVGAGKADGDGIGILAIDYFFAWGFVVLFPLLWALTIVNESASSKTKE